MGTLTVWRLPLMNLSHLQNKSLARRQVGFVLRLRHTYTCCRLRAFSSEGLVFRISSEPGLYHTPVLLYHKNPLPLRDTHNPSPRYTRGTGMGTPHQLPSPS